MAANVGGIDRTLRIVVGIVVLALFFVLEGNARYWALLGIVPLFTGLFRFCPAYTLLGVSTCPMKK
jgi:predicted RND superfamily exporter protein